VFSPRVAEKGKFQRPMIEHFSSIRVLTSTSTVLVLGCEHKSVEHFPTRRNYYVCNRLFVFFLQLLGQSTLNFGEGKKSVELSPSG